jgi:hypothetical protein
VIEDPDRTAEIVSAVVDGPDIDTVVNVFRKRPPGDTSDERNKDEDKTATPA